MDTIARKLSTILLFSLLIFILGMDMIKNAEAENIAGPFKDNCPRYPGCLMNGVILKTKYGVLTAQRNMVFNRIDVNANGSIIFDLSTWVPRAEEILLFNAVSFGNGTFPIQILGPPITAVAFGAAYTAQFSTQLTGGPGGIVNLVAGSNMTQALQLVINYTPFGGACTFLCIPGLGAIGGILIMGGGIILLGWLVLAGSRRKEKEKEEQLAEIGGEPE